MSNREIKFRLWKDGKMHVASLRDIIRQLGFEYGCPDDIAPYVINNQDVDIWPIMQYTGLRDKHGAEIYEGDIIVWNVNDISRTAPIYFDDEQACFWMGKDKDSGHLVLNDWMRGEYEVIGNIYANPELLEVKK